MKPNHSFLMLLTTLILLFPESGNAFFLRPVSPYSPTDQKECEQLLDNYKKAAKSNEDMHKFYYDKADEITRGNIDDQIRNNHEALRLQNLGDKEQEEAQYIMSEGFKATQECRERVSQYQQKRQAEERKHQAEEQEKARVSQERELQDQKRKEERANRDQQYERERTRDQQAREQERRRNEQAEAQTSAQQQYQETPRQAGRRVLGELPKGAAGVVLDVPRVAVNVDRNKVLRMENPFSIKESISDIGKESAAKSINAKLNKEGTNLTIPGSEGHDDRLDKVHEMSSYALSGPNPFSAEVSKQSLNTLKQIQNKTLGNMDEVGKSISDMTVPSPSRPSSSSGNPFKGTPIHSYGSGEEPSIVKESKDTSAKLPVTSNYQWHDQATDQIIDVPQGTTLYRNPSTLELSVESTSSPKYKTFGGDYILNGKLICSKDRKGKIIPKCESVSSRAR